MPARAPAPGGGARQDDRWSLPDRRESFGRRGCDRARGAGCKRIRNSFGSPAPSASKQNPRRKAGGYGKNSGRVTGLPAASGHLEILRRCLAAIGHELVLDSLTFVERAETSALDRRDMDEDVLFSARGPNEPVAFSWIEPFDGALLHRLSPRQAGLEVSDAKPHRCGPRHNPGFGKIRNEAAS